MEHLRVNGILFRVEQMGSADAPAVVLSNSLGSDMSMWGFQTQVLAEKYRVICVDTRGHGGTEASDGDYSLDLLADDVLGVMDSLNVQRAHFIGLSLGGMIGQVLGARNGDRFFSMTLCATFADTPRQLWADRVEAVRAHGVAPLVEGSLERWFTPGFRASAPDLMDRVRAMITSTSAKGYAGCAAAIRDMDLTGVPEQISVPTLVIAATLDPSATLEAMKQLHGRIRGATFAEIDDAAHVFTLEKPRETNEIILNFLENIQE